MGLGPDAKAFHKKTVAETLLQAVQLHAAERPDACALLAPGRAPLTFAGLQTSIENTRRQFLQLGLLQSSRIAVALPAGPDLAVGLLTCAVHGVAAPVNPASRQEELRSHLSAVRADAVLVQQGDDGAVRAVAQESGVRVIEVIPDMRAAGRFDIQGASESQSDPRPPAQDDVALVLLTSGTTGQPKVVALTHRRLVASAANIARHLELTPADRSLLVMPLFHSHGVVGAWLSSLVAGASVVCPPGWDERQFAEWVTEFQPTWYTATPPIHHRVIARAADYRAKAPEHRFRFVRSTSAPLSAAVSSQLEEALSASVIESFGMTEWSQMASNPLPPRVRKPGSVGQPTGVEIAIVCGDGSIGQHATSGEIVVRGDDLTTTYEGEANAPADRASDGWFRTGDRGRFDSDGYLFIEERLSDVINRGGEKVSPFEIEAALLRHRDIEQAAAFPIPHPTLGEDVAVAVVAREGSRTGEQAIRTFLLDVLSETKVPSLILLVAEIPRTELGKLRRRQLHDHYARGITRQGVPPASEMEDNLVSVVSGVLKRPVGTHDNFFAAGGDSLSGIRVVTRINRQFGIKLPATTLFRFPTIAALAAEVTRVLSTVPGTTHRLPNESATLSA